MQKKFDIKYDISKVIGHSIYGHVCLKIDKYSLGYYGEEVNLGSVEYNLFRLLNNRNNEFPELDNLTGKEIFDIISTSSNIKFDYTFLSLPESFDDFVIRVFRIDDNFRFLWMLVDDPFYKYKNMVSGEVIDFTIPIKNVSEVIINFRKSLQKLSSSQPPTD